MFLPRMTNEDIYRLYERDKDDIYRQKKKKIAEIKKTALRSGSYFPRIFFDLFTSKSGNTYILNIVVPNAKTAYSMDLKNIYITTNGVFKYNDGHYGLYFITSNKDGYAEFTHHFFSRYSKRMQVSYDNEIELIKTYFERNFNLLPSHEYLNAKEEDVKDETIPYVCHDGIAYVLQDSKRKISIIKTFIATETLGVAKLIHNNTYNICVEEELLTNSKNTKYPKELLCKRN